MPPARSQRPRPQTDRCRFADHAGRCRRLATVAPGYCRAHAIQLEGGLTTGLATGILGAVDRMFTGGGRPPPIRAVVSSLVTGALAGVMNTPQAQRTVPRAQLEQMRAQLEQAQRAQEAAAARARARRAAGARAEAGQPPPRAAAPPPVDPLLAAREVLGFEPAEPLTREKVQDRKKALARVFHPDMAGGSKAAMQRVLTSADALLASMA